jgi:phosphate/sulfate permease
MRLSLLVAVAVVVGSIALGIAVNFATGSSLSQWDSTASIVAAAVGVLGVLIAVLSSFIAERSSNAEDKAELTHEQLAFKLIRTFAAIERDASEYQLRSKAVASRPLSLREVRSMMADIGVWNYEDQIAFDLATRARNSIVHGDLNEIDPLDLQYAVDKAEQLLRKLQGAEPTERPME